MATPTPPKGRTAPTDALAAATLAAYYLRRDDVAQARRKLRQALAALSTQNPKKYCLPEKDRLAILQKSDYFNQKQEIEAQRQRFIKINGNDGVHDAN